MSLQKIVAVSLIGLGGFLFTSKKTLVPEIKKESKAKSDDKKVDDKTEDKKDDLIVD